MNKIIKIKNKGFSLIELMVATSIFVVIMLAAMGALFSLLDGSKEARALRISMDNINFAMESMTRSIRMGKNYYCTDSDKLQNIMRREEGSQDCADGKNAFAFIPIEKDGKGTRLGYKHQIINNKGFLKRCDDVNPNNCVDLVSPDVNITNLKFFTFGSEDPSKQASTYIIIKGEIITENGIIPFNLQTMVSSHNF